MQIEPFHLSRSSDGKSEWFSARDAATGVSIPCDCKDRAIALVTSLNAAFKHHKAMAINAERQRCAGIAYRVCAETRHVTLGDKARDAINAKGSDHE